MKGSRRALSRMAGVLACVSGLAGCLGEPSDSSLEEAHTEEAESAPPHAVSTASASPVASASPAPSGKAVPPPRVTIDGRAFPDKVLSLTWDDGPDAHTLELAEYLHEHHVAATFFVVAAWEKGVSSDPGWGTGVFDTGLRSLPLLGELTKLGHRVANHTKNHVLLGDASPGAVLEQLREDQRRLDPWIRNDLRLFRAPGGAWSEAASAAVDGDPELRRLVGPVRWDIDRKDWEGSVYCRSDHPRTECEELRPGGRRHTKSAVVAARYLESIAEAGHGIVLFHDRVGLVGSRYALKIAHRVIPELEARGFVFAAPVLRFSPFAPHPMELAEPVALCGKPGAPDQPRGCHFLEGDLNGDGRPDVCGRAPDGVWCSLRGPEGLTEARLWQEEASDAAGFGSPERSASLELLDVNGDGRADLCGRGAQGPVCALAP